MASGTPRLGVAVVALGVALATAHGCTAAPDSSSDERTIDEPTMSTTRSDLAAAVSANPLPDFADWWPIGNAFASLMSEAIISEWSALAGNDDSFDAVAAHVAEYLDVVYAREGRTSLVDDFAAARFPTPLASGEFDALSYGFFRSAFDLIERNIGASSTALEDERRQFTRRVGRRTFEALEARLELDLPADLETPENFEQLRAAIARVMAFLGTEGYFRGEGAFRFDVDVEHHGERIGQPEAEFVARLAETGSAHALFEMSYPVILPSAVYLFATVGEAQHHSSRTVEELFARAGYAASETHNFDPSGYPPDMVVELWEIRTR